MSNIWYSSVVQYFGDSLLVLLFLYGMVVLVGLCTKRFNRYIFVNIEARDLFRFSWVLLGISFFNLVAFKFLVLQHSDPYSKNITAGSHGSLQFSLAGDIAAAIAVVFGIYGAYRLGRKYLRLVEA